MIEIEDSLRQNRRESQCKEYIFSYIRLLKAPTSGANPVAPTVGALGQTTGNIARCPFKNSEAIYGTAYQK